MLIALKDKISFEEAVVLVEKIGEGNYGLSDGKDGWSLEQRPAHVKLVTTPTEKAEGPVIVRVRREEEPLNTHEDTKGRVRGLSSLSRGSEVQEEDESDDGDVSVVSTVSVASQVGGGGLTRNKCATTVSELMGKAHGSKDPASRASRRAIFSMLVELCWRHGVEMIAAIIPDVVQDAYIGERCLHRIMDMDTEDGISEQEMLAILDEFMPGDLDQVHDQVLGYAFDNPAGFATWLAKAEALYRTDIALLIGLINSKLPQEAVQSLSTCRPMESEYCTEALDEYLKVVRRVMRHLPKATKKPAVPPRTGFPTPAPGAPMMMGSPGQVTPRPVTKWCHFHQTRSHDWSECRANPENQGAALRQGAGMGNKQVNPKGRPEDGKPKEE